MANRGAGRSQCSSCGKFYNKRCGKCSSHHTRPRSRGGDDGIPNETNRDKQEHSAWHNLHGNLRVGEVARLVLFDWETHNPYSEEKEKFTDITRLKERIQSWDLLYGQNATRCLVMTVIITKFTRISIDRAHIRKVLKSALFTKRISKKDYIQLIKLVDNKIEK